MLIRIILRNYLDGTIIYNSIIVSLCMGILGITVILVIHYICKNVSITKKVANSKAFIHIEKLSYYIFVVHYTFVADTNYNIYENSNSLILASVKFFIITIIFAILLQTVSEKVEFYIERGIEKLNRC